MLFQCVDMPGLIWIRFPMRRRYADFVIGYSPASAPISKFMQKRPRSRFANITYIPIIRGYSSLLWLEKQFLQLTDRLNPDLNELDDTKYQRLLAIRH